MGQQPLASSLVQGRRVSIGDSGTSSVTRSPCPVLGVLSSDSGVLPIGLGTGQLSKSFRSLWNAQTLVSHRMHSSI